MANLSSIEIIFAHIFYNNCTRDLAVESAIGYYNLVTGPIFLLINAAVLAIIVTDTDKRSAAYRKYQISLQILSMIQDAGLSGTCAVAVVKCRIIYMTGLTSIFIPAFWIAISLIIIEAHVLLAYLACALYRRHCIKLVRAKRSMKVEIYLPLILLEITGCLVAANTIRNPEVIFYKTEEVPTELRWVISHSFVMIKFNMQALIAYAPDIVFLAVLAAFVLLLFFDVMRRMSNLSSNISVRKKQYHRKAQFLLILQFVVPGIAICIPLLADISITALINTNTAYSAYVFSLMNTHGVINSMVLILGTTSFRQRIAAPFTRLRNGVPKNASTTRSVGVKPMAQILAANSPDTQELFLSMRLASIALLFVLAYLAQSLKFLCYSPALYRSHVNFLGKLSDALIDAGHEVVMLMPMHDTTLGTRGSEKARILEIPQVEESKRLEEEINKESGFMKSVWKNENALDGISTLFIFQDPFMKQCNATLNHPGLFEQLQKEKFDAAFFEMMDYCGMAVLKKLNIDKFAVTMSIGTMEGSFHITGAPDFPAYVPSMLGDVSDSMTFLQRMGNMMFSYIMPTFFPLFNAKVEKLVAEMHPDWGSLYKMYEDASLYFVNNEPLIEFQRPITHKVMDIGGISAHHHHKPLNETWSKILSLRPKTVLLSFGSVAKSFLMPEQYKQSILAALKKFPEVTFIWKYEVPEHRISEGVDNVVESTWVPQNDLLHDPRLSLFITHCGAGSTYEAARAGKSRKPLIVIPVMGDQKRNAQMVKKLGTGISLEKEDLVNPKKLEDSIREALSTDKYKKAAEYTADMLLHRPFNMKEVFVKNMEFMAKYGPLRMLDHHSRNLNFIQYYLIDVFAFLAAIVVIAITTMIFIFRCTTKMICYVIRNGKAKKE